MSQDKKVFEIGRREAKEALDRGRAVIVDATNLTRKQRRQRLSLAGKGIDTFNNIGPMGQMVVKYKWPRYVEANRIMRSGASYSSLLDALRTNKLDDLLASAPAEVRAVMEERVQEILNWRRHKLEIARMHFESLKPLAEHGRKAFAAAAQEVPVELRGAMFRWLDGRDWDPLDGARPGDIADSAIDSNFALDA